MPNKEFIYLKKGKTYDTYKITDIIKTYNEYEDRYYYKNIIVKNGSITIDADNTYYIDNNTKYEYANLFKNSNYYNKTIVSVNDVIEKNKINSTQKKSSTSKNNTNSSNGIDHSAKSYNSTYVVDDNYTVYIYKDSDIIYENNGNKYNGKPDYYRLKSNAFPIAVLHEGTMIRGTKPSNSCSFIEISEVVYTEGNGPKYTGYWAKIIVDNQVLIRNATNDDVEEAKENGEDTSEFEEAMELNSAVEKEINNPNDIEQVAAPIYTADEFLIEYESDVSSSNISDYVKSLESSNYNLKINNLRSIFGVPHQFLPRTDARIAIGSSSSGCGDLSDIGRMYGEKILKNMPILYITPGTPDFLAGFNDKQQNSLLEALISGNTNDDIKSLINNSGGRYYSLKFDYTSYFRYVNTMLRSAALFLGIGDETLNNKRLDEYNWMLISDSRDNGAPEIKKRDGVIQKVEKASTNIISGLVGLKEFMGQHWGTLAFYADCGDQIDDSFSNSTTQSQLSSSINSLSDLGKELHFLSGLVGSNIGLELDELIGGGDSGLTGSLSDATKMVSDTLGSNNLISNILGKAQTFLSGGKMIFPEIWADSSFSRSYNFRIKLVSPSGDKLSVFLNILVPIYHILALALPRQSAAPEGYFSPFLVRAYSKGLFNIDMGIITDLNITKGAEAEWTADGIPTVAEISFTIKELYNNLSMSMWHQSVLEGSEGSGNLNILSNIAELDYIANSCGVNINEQDVWRMLKFAKALGFAGLKDVVELDIFGAFNQYLDNSNAKIFGIF